MTTTHELTVETTRTDDDRWRVVATCSCLHFARTGIASNRSVAEAAIDIMDSHHMAHVERCEQGVGYAPDPSEWLA